MARSLVNCGGGGGGTRLCKPGMRFAYRPSNTQIFLISRRLQRRHLSLNFDGGNGDVAIDFCNRNSETLLLLSWFFL